MFLKLSHLSCVLLLTMLPLAATTTNLIGVVEETKVETKQRGDKTYSTLIVRLRNIWGFTRYPGVDDTRIELKVSGKAMIFLDGAKSTAEAAFKPGHLVKVMGDVQYYACYSEDFHFTEQIADSFGPDRGVYRLRLPKAASATYRYTGKPGKSDKITDTSFSSDLSLHLLCRAGAVVAIAATQDIGRMGGIRVFSLPIVHDLRIADGRVQGTVTVSLLSQGRYLTAGESGSEERRFTIDAPLGQSKAEGSFTSSDKTQTLTIYGRGEVVLPSQRAVLFYSTSGTGGNRGPQGEGESVSLDARFDGDTLGEWHLSTFGKGYPSYSTITRYELQWDDFRFSGTIALDNADDKRAPKGTVQIEGVVIGDQLFGSTRSDTKTENLPGRLRGQIFKPTAPPLIGWDEGKAKRWVKAHPQSDVPMPDRKKVIE